MRRTTLVCQFQSILCPVDFSRHSAAALRHAAALARTGKGPVTALFVVDPLLSAAAATAYDEHALERTSRQELRKFVARTLTSTDARNVRYVTAVGRAPREILAAAKRSRADVIVVGTHGLGGVQKAFFGSTTDQVLRRSTVPVLAVPATVSAPRRGWPRRLVVAALELDARAPRDMAAVACIARGLRARLVVVHVVPPLRMPPWLRGDSRAHAAARVAEAKRQLDDVCGALGEAVASESRVLVGDPAETIAAVAAKERADMLVLTLRKAAGLLQGRRRATAYRVLVAVRAPVLAWPATASEPRRLRK
jgi:nucleotide-binding universal stress UspA family protein